MYALMTFLTCNSLMLCTLIFNFHSLMSCVIANMLFLPLFAKMSFEEVAKEYTVEDWQK